MIFKLTLLHNWRLDFFPPNASIKLFHLSMSFQNQRFPFCSIRSSPDVRWKVRVAVTIDFYRFPTSIFSTTNGSISSIMVLTDCLLSVNSRQIPKNGIILNVLEFSETEETKKKSFELVLIYFPFIHIYHLGFLQSINSSTVFNL